MEKAKDVMKLLEIKGENLTKTLGHVRLNSLHISSLG